MASKVMVKIPVAPFAQVNKSKTGNVNGELLAVSRPPEIPPRSPERCRGPEGMRIAQLEQNIRFLQEQHQLMLSGLHNEIESLRNRNRDLQFQLVFVKGTLPSSPSSPEDETKHKVYTSPKQINITPLQVEILEKELGELKIQLQEVDGRNVYLSAIVDEQKKKLERYERDREKERERALQPDPELLRKLDDAEAIIRRLRRENSDLRRESSVAAPSHFHSNGASYSKDPSQPKGGKSRGGNRHRNNSAHYNSGGGGGGNQREGNWFPPLHSQSYWQGGRGDKSGGGNGGGGGGNGAGGGGGGGGGSGIQSDGDTTPLPSLQGHASTNSPQYQGRRGTNNNHYHHGDGRKYKGGHKPKPA